MTATELGALLLRSTGTVSAVGMSLAILPVARVLCSVCVRCGRDHATAARSGDVDAERWGRAGAYFALACFAVRMIPAVQEWIGARGIEGPRGFLQYFSARPVERWRSSRTPGGESDWRSPVRLTPAGRPPCPLTKHAPAASAHPLVPGIER